MTMNDRVRKAIRDCGLTPYAIAKASGVTKGTLSRFMGGTRDISLNVLERIAPHIGVTLHVESPAKGESKAKASKRTKGK